MADFRALCAELLRAMDEITEYGIVDWAYVKSKPFKMADKSMEEARAALDEPVKEGPTDEDILRFADDLSILKGCAVDGYSRWEYSEDFYGHGDYETVDATNEVLSLARFVTTTLPLTPGRKNDV